MIRLIRLFKQYHKREPFALWDVSLDIEQGEFVYLMGESGSGKSTLLNHLYANETPSAGHVAVDSFIINQLKPNERFKLRRHVGVVFQDYTLLEYKTVFDNVAYVLEVTNTTPKEIEDKVMDALTMVGLRDKALDFPHDCSGGERQRIAIARAIVHQPLILIADEPTGNLDPRKSLDILTLLHKINKSGVTVIMSTHDYRLVEHMPARVVRLSGGKVISDRSKDHTLLILNNRLGDCYVV